MNELTGDVNPVLPLLGSAADDASVSTDFGLLLARGEHSLLTLVAAERRDALGEEFDVAAIYSALPKAGPLFPRIARFAGLAAIAGGDLDLFDRVLADLAAYGQSHGGVHAALAKTLVEGEFQLRLNGADGLPEWLERGDFTMVPEVWRPHVAYLAFRKLLVERRHVEALSAGRVIFLESRGANARQDLWLKLACADCCRELRRSEEQARWTHLAARAAKASGVIAPYFEFLSGPADPLLAPLADLAPALADRIRELEPRQFLNAIRVRNHWRGHAVTTKLTRRQMYIVSHLARGIRYREVAELMRLSHGRFRNLCTEVYAILDIHHRRELRDLVW